ncbi:hypothetical protein VMCG_04289 [Cytospora schulzeri]|uniref:NADP-dependent oxidoreductase domain-containing protein n=1 Tax=Cytospora schulzeri TaxID=448051 RepID=A0A423WSR4_9PEZI|nr:hypothetical protein VMCG_04289 [Valsa malicola]
METSLEEVRMSEALAKVAEEHGTKSIHAVALAYVIHKAPNVFPVVGCKRVEQLKDNIQAFSIKLTKQQILSLEGVKTFDPGFPLNFIGEDPNVTGHNWLLATSAQVAFPNARKY